MYEEYDYVVIGSGFGGSVSALRLAEKGYSVLVIEKGDWKNPEDFPKTNWDLKKWLWFPFFGFKGIFKLTFLRHLSVISGVGVGGGSLVYSNTLPIQKMIFLNPVRGKGLQIGKMSCCHFIKKQRRCLELPKTQNFLMAIGI